jgi:hypothetical protein
MVADFDAAYDQYRAEQAPPPPVEPVEKKRIPAKDYRFSLAILIPLILLLTVAVWWRHHSKATEATQIVDAASPGSEDRSPALPSTAVDVTASKVKQSIGNSKSAATEQPAKKVAGSSGNGSTETQPASGAALQSPELAAATKPKPIRLEIHANQDSWMSVIADGKTMMEGVLPATSTKKFHAKKNIYFTTGNAGGVEVSYNGRPLPPLGTSNEVKSLTFTSEGPRQ